jgi:hypothetical protein
MDSVHSLFLFSMENTDIPDTLASSVANSRERFTAAWAYLLQRYTWFQAYDFYYVELARGLPFDTIWVEAVKRDHVRTYPALVTTLSVVSSEEDCDVMYTSQTRREARAAFVALESMVARFNDNPRFACTLLRKIEGESLSYLNAIGRRVTITLFALNDQNLHNLRGRRITMITGYHHCTPANIRGLMLFFLPMMGAMLQGWRFLLFDENREPREGEEETG